MWEAVRIEKEADEIYLADRKVLRTAEELNFADQAGKPTAVNLILA